MEPKSGVEVPRTNTQLSAKGFCKRSFFDLNIKKINFCAKVVEIMFWSWDQYSGGYLVSGEFRFWPYGATLHGVQIKNGLRSLKEDTLEVLKHLKP